MFNIFFCCSYDFIQSFLSVKLLKNLKFLKISGISEIPAEAKGSVSRILRWVLLYISQKLSLRPFSASHKIFNSLKG